LKENNGYNIYATEEQIKEIIKNETRAYPYTTRTMNRAWNIMLQKSHMDKKDKNGGIPEKHERNVHSLRKYFRQNYGKYSDNLAEYFMNHRTELSRIYDDKPDEWLDEQYMNGAHFLTIYETPMEPSTRIKELEEQVRNLEEKVTWFDKLDKKEMAHLIKHLVEKNEK